LISAIFSFGAIKFPFSSLGYIMERKTGARFLDSIHDAAVSEFWHVYHGH